MENTKSLRRMRLIMQKGLSYLIAGALSVGLVFSIDAIDKYFVRNSDKTAVINFRDKNGFFYLNHKEAEPLRTSNNVPIVINKYNAGVLEGDNVKRIDITTVGIETGRLNTGYMNPPTFNKFLVDIGNDGHLEGVLEGENNPYSGSSYPTLDRISRYRPATEDERRGYLVLTQGANIERLLLAK